MMIILYHNLPLEYGVTFDSLKIWIIISGSDALTVSGICLEVQSSSH